MPEDAEVVRQRKSLVGGRQRLMATEYHVPPNVLSELTSKTRFEQEDMVLPALLECFRPRVSFTLRFHARRHATNTVVVLEVCNFKSEASDALVVCVCTGEPHPFMSTLATSGRADFPATQRVESFTGNGCRCTYRAVWTRQMAVRVEVYAAEKIHQVAGPRALGSDLETARRQGVLSDVVLKVDGEDLLAHRAVLAARSPVFLGMLQSGFKEDLEGVVRVEGVSAGLFKKFLAYLYRGDLELEEDWQGCEVDLLELADRYLVDPLKAECERRLLQVGMDAVVGLLETVAQRPSVTSAVRTRAVEVVVENWCHVSATPEWADFANRNPVLADFIRGGHQARRRSHEDCTLLQSAK